MIRILTCIALASGAWLALPAPALAAESYDNCTGFIASLPATITTQGTWCLNKDLATSMTSGNAITIATNNVTLDCNHFKIGGLSAGTGTFAYGVRADSKLNATIRNCNIRGFYMGFYLVGGGHLVENNSFDGNTYIGMYVNGPGSTIRNNLVIDTGGSTHISTAYGINVANGVDVLDNTINGVAGTGTDATVFGIFYSSSNVGSINGNRVRGLASAGNGAPFGIYAYNPSRGVIRDNDVQGPDPGVAGGIGIYCSTNAITAHGNVIAGFATGVSPLCLDSSNIVNTN
jgi:hypothetical protein